MCSDRATVGGFVRWALDDPSPLSDTLESIAAEESEDERNALRVYLGALLVSYLYYRRLYEAEGVRDLSDFWTTYDTERRQGTRAPSRADLDWTVRAAPEEEPPAVFPPAVPPPPLPPPPAVVADPGRGRR